MNVMITNQCNLRCSYCFASEKLGVEHITLDAFREVLAFIPPGGHLGLIGGEPTLHPQFTELLRMAVSSHLGSITVFTNGTTLLDWEHLLTHRKVGLLVNVNSVETMEEEAYSSMLKSISILHNRYLSHNIGLGLNLHSTQVPQLWDLVDLAGHIGIKSLRLSVSVPPMQYLRGNSILDYFKGLKQTYLNVCTVFDDIGVAVRQDCNYIPVCVFNSAEQSFLHDLTQKYSTLLGEPQNYLDRTVCTPVIDIMPDLTVIRCFGVNSAVQVNMRDFSCVEELRGYFSRHVDIPLNCRYISKECIVCRELSLGCNMGCLRARLSECSGIVRSEATI